MTIKQKQNIGDNSFGIQANNLIINIVPQILSKFNKKYIETLSISELNENFKIVLDPPILPYKISERKEVVEYFYNKLKIVTWLGIYGEKGIGKTYLSLLLKTKFTGSKYWIPFKDIKSESLNLYLDQVFYNYFGKRIPTKNLFDYFNNIFSKTSSESLVIFDDLPNLNIDNNFLLKIFSIVRACNKNGIKCLSTSFYDIPESMKLDMNPDIFEIIKCPSFRKYEIIELLEKNNASNKIINDEFVELILSLTKGQPILINALMRYLRKNRWKLDSRIFEDILKSSYAKNEKREILTFFSKTVPNDVKELIYRLDLILANFTESEVNLISDIKPEIKHPFEKFNYVLNIWIQQIGDEFYISPLIKGFGKKNLNQEIMREIYFRLAKNIVRRNKLNQKDASQVILYYHMAEEYNLSALVLKDILIEFLKVENEHFYDWGIFQIWSNQPMPEEINLDLRLIIRGLQIRINQKFNRDSTFILKDIDKLVNSAKENEFLGLLNCTTSLINEKLNKKSSLLFYKCFLKTLKLKKVKELFPINKQFYLEHSMWIIAFNIIEADQLLDWIDTLDKMPTESLNILFDIERLIEKINYIFDNIYLNELKKEKIQQNWKGLIKSFEMIEKKSRKIEIEIIWAQSIKIQIMIISEQLNDFKSTIQMGKESLKIASNNPVVQYILKEIMAREYLFSKEYEEADKWFTLALKEKIGSRLVESKLLSLQWHSEAVSYINLDKSIKICEEAIDFAEKNIIAKSNNLLIMTYGEYSILLFKRSGISSAFTPYEKGIDLLWSSKIKNRSWKEQFVMYGHLSGYFYSIAVSGEPPTRTKNGEVYSPPFTGMFINIKDEVINIYNKSNEHFLPIQVALYAEAISQDEKAIKWALRAQKIIPKNDTFFSYVIFIQIIIPNLIIEEKFIEAINLFIEITCENKNELHNDLLKKNRKEYFLLNVLIPIMFKIGVLKNLDSIESDYFSEIVQNFNNLSSRILPIDEELWSSIIKIFEVCLLEKYTLNEANLLCNDYIRRSEKLLAMLCNVGANLKNDILPEYAIQAQEVLFYNIQAIYYKNFKFIYRKLIINFFKIYWTKKFEVYKFRFNSPDLFKKEFNKTLQKNSENVIFNIIKTVKKYLR